MRGLLGWLGSFFGADGAELMEEESAAVRGNLGRGLFSPEPGTLHQELLDVLGVGLAFVRAYAERLPRDANPGLAVDTIGEWEDQLGVPRAGRDFGSSSDSSLSWRQENLRAHCKIPRSANERRIEVACRKFLGAAFVNITSPSALTYLVHADATILATLDHAEERGANCLRYLRWVSPAHVFVDLVSP